jgi:hypothetical protein
VVVVPDNKRQELEANENYIVDFDDLQEGVHEAVKGKLVDDEEDVQ